MKTRSIFFIVIPIVVFVLVFGGIPFNTLSTFEYTFHSVERMIEETDVIVIAQVESSYSIPRIDDELNFDIWTKTVLKPEQFLKNYDDLDPMQNIVTIAEGGQFLSYKHESNSEKFNVGDRVLVFLDKDVDSVIGDFYYVGWGPWGQYVLKDGVAHHISWERTTTEDELVSLIIGEIENE